MSDIDGYLLFCPALHACHIQQVALVVYIDLSSVFCRSIDFLSFDCLLATRLALLLFMPFCTASLVLPWLTAFLRSSPEREHAPKRSRMRGSRNNLERFSSGTNFPYSLWCQRVNDSRSSFPQRGFLGPAGTSGLAGHSPLEFTCTSPPCFGAGTG
jgi:hypothetical protein